MGRTYQEYMKEIGKKDLYDGLVEHGLFSSSLPPIFDNSDFMVYCKNKQQDFEHRYYGYVTFYANRNINVPRILGIPVPMAHEILCNTLSISWEKIREHFEMCTSTDKYRISRIHLKMQQGTNCLLNMNYDTFDDRPELDISIGKRYIVKTDISKCFSSIYTHAISWALDSKAAAKKKCNESIWYNDIDKDLRSSTFGETHGLLIGPHTSNLMSEIILCKVDKILVSNGWEYVRHIDDYECYVKTEDEAKQFIIQLTSALKEYGLLLNQNKTMIKKLPFADFSSWDMNIKSMVACLGEKDVIDYVDINIFINKCLELMDEYSGNASVIVYGVKSLSPEKMSANAKQCVFKKVLSLATIFPYLIVHLDDMILSRYSLGDQDLQKYLNLLYSEYITSGDFSSASFVIQLSLKYNVILEEFNVDKIIEMDDCILLLCGFLYSRRYQLSKSLSKLKKYANELRERNDMDSYWPFVYESSSAANLDRDWKKLKNNGVSFIRDEYRY